MPETFGANFKIDITQLKAGLTTANKLIRESESEFKKASSGLDDWTKSEDGLTARIKSLNSVVEIQGKRSMRSKRSIRNSSAKVLMRRATGQ